MATLSLPLLSLLFSWSHPRCTQQHVCAHAIHTCTERDVDTFCGPVTCIYLLSVYALHAPGQHTCVFTLLYACVCTFLSVCMHYALTGACVPVYVHIHGLMCRCVRVHVIYVDTCMYNVCTYVCTYVGRRQVHMFMFVCMYIMYTQYMYLYLHLNLCMYMYMCRCTCVYVYVYMYMCTCICVWTSI